MAILTDTKARNIKPDSNPIAHGGVPGLYLLAGSKKGTGKWILRFVSPVTKKRRDMGLGTYPDTGIAVAGQSASDARQIIGMGLDPIEQRKASLIHQQAESNTLTFEMAARQVHQENLEGWINRKHIAQWIKTLEDYIFPTLGGIRVSELKPHHFADALRPIWLEKPETASRTKQRCHAVMDWCWAKGLVSANPIGVVDKLLPKKKTVEQHQPSMPWKEIPAYISEYLTERQPADSAKAALEFLILTAARSGAVRLMTWSEINCKKAIWTIPPENGRKTDVPRRIPLSDRAIEILNHQKALGLSEELVFPSPRGKALSDMTLTAILRRTQAQSATEGRTATAHGFRGSFRNWASEQGYSRDLAERQLSHEIQNKVEAAYHTTDLLDERRPMMQKWADFLVGKKGN